MTPTKNDIKQQEVEKNFDFFMSVMPEYTESHGGRYALLRHKKIIDFYDTIRDAYTTGERNYNDGLFSIQQVNPRPVDLGAYSHAVHLG